MTYLGRWCVQDVEPETLQVIHGSSEHIMIMTWTENICKLHKKWETQPSIKLDQRSAATGRLLQGIIESGADREHNDINYKTPAGSNLKTNC